MHLVCEFLIILQILSYIYNIYLFIFVYHILLYYCL